MPRRKSTVDLPPNVSRVLSKGKPYYYYQEARGTDHASRRVRLPDDPWSLDFASKVEELAGRSSVDPERSIRALVAAFRASPEWKVYKPTTQRDYSFYLDKLVGKWGKLPTKGVRPKHVLALRDSMASSPGAANYLLTIGRVLFQWGIPRELAEINPFRDVKDLVLADDGYWPWPDWALTEIYERAPPDLYRFFRLALATGQRESDVVRMGPANLEGRGLIVRPGKTERKRKAFWCPLQAAAFIEIDRWEKEPLVFHPQRFKAPVSYLTSTHYIVSPAGNPYSATGLSSRWNRWLQTQHGLALLKRWEKWERGIRERDGEIVPELAVLRPALHGLRSTAVVHRRLAGYKDEDIANDIGMSLVMVRRYSRFIDQRLAAETNIVLLENARKA